MGRYGEEPQAESAVPISLKECHQRLSLKPTDFISTGEPDFFNKAYGAKGRYLVFLAEPSEIDSNPIWKPGYYLLPLEAADVLRAFDKNKQGPAGNRVLPVEIESKDPIPPEMTNIIEAWIKQCQPMFFKCQCDHLTLKLAAPWAMRKRWRARLSCPDRCQPTLSTEL
jgi:hypothetical protein